jgi:hypothetical protein
VAKLAELECHAPDQLERGKAKSLEPAQQQNVMKGLQAPR